MPGSFCAAGPILYQVHTRDWLTRCSRGGALCRLNQIPEAELDLLARLGFDWLWLLGVWQTGPAGAKVSRTHEPWRHAFTEALPDLEEQDIVGSTFAIRSYTVHVDFGGDEALAQFRERLHGKGIRLLLDFVPNHTALDHPWVEAHPDYYIHGTEADLQTGPDRFLRLGGEILAYGRDPYFPGWPDTLQLNYGNPALQSAMRNELLHVAERCDGVRCDMAMLLLPEVFGRTWGIEAQPFWSLAIAAVRQAQPSFLLVAEVYWGLDGELQATGFDYTYDKALYDRVLARDVNGLRHHLANDTAFLAKSVYFLENHDERRAAVALPDDVHMAAAAITFLPPGLRFFHDGELTGYRRKPSIHLARRAPEEPQPALASFYRKLLQLLKKFGRDTRFSLLETRSAWDGNPTHANFLCFAFSANSTLDGLAVINYSAVRSQCYLSMPDSLPPNGASEFRDWMGAERFRRLHTELLGKGLYLDVRPWAFQFFQLTTDW